MPDEQHEPISPPQPPVIEAKPAASYGTAMATVTAMAAGPRSVRREGEMEVVAVARLEPPKSKVQTTTLSIDASEHFEVS